MRRQYEDKHGSLGYFKIEVSVGDPAGEIFNKQYNRRIISSFDRADADFDLEVVSLKTVVEARQSSEIAPGEYIE